MKKRPLCVMCLIFLAVKCVIMIFSGGQTGGMPAASVFQEGKDRSVQAEGRVYKKESTSDYQILYLKNNIITYQNQSYYESNLIVYMEPYQDVAIGKAISLSGLTGTFEGARNPGNFDRSLYYARKHIYGYVRCKNLTSVTGNTDRFSEMLYQLRQRWKTLLLSSMSEENGPILSAMLLGEKGEMEDSIKELYQKNGISHALAISGLHISFLGLGIYYLLRKVGLPMGVSGVIAVLVLTGYVLMIGFSVSVMRAYVMLLLRMGADFFGRVYDSLTAVCLAAALIVFYEPLYLTDAAFWMSHGAILGILFILPVFKTLVRGEPPVFCRKLLEAAFASLAIHLALFPVLLWFYFEIPTYSTFLNMLVIPLMSVVLGFGMAGSGLSLVILPLGRLFLKVCDWILSLFTFLGRIGYQLPFSRIVFGKPALWQAAVYYAVLLVWILVSGAKKEERRWKKWQLLSCALLPLSILLFVKFPTGTLKITMLDVGQGDCLFFQGPTGTTYLVDGGSSDVNQVGKYRIDPFLRSQGVGEVDYVFLSHGDLDHYSGITELLERQEAGVTISNLILPANYQEDESLRKIAALAKANGTSTFVIKPGESLSEGALKITCLLPGGKEQEESILLTGNAASMVLKVEFENFRMLCTGDLEGKGEEALLDLLKGTSGFDILKVAHHGSKNSTGEELLKLLHPRIALISAGEGNSYGHPHEETLEKLEGVGCQIMETMKNGGILMETDGDSIDIFPSSL